MTTLQIVHFSDILCVWAYVGQSNLEKLEEDFGSTVDVETRFCSVFPNSHGKIEKMWLNRGGFDGYADHVRQVVDGFPDVELHVDAWTRTRPKSSASPHLFVKALELVQDESPRSIELQCLTSRAVRQLRTAFFVEGKDVSNWSAQKEICTRLNVEFERIV